MRLCMLQKLHYGHMAADGMLKPIPIRRASRHLNSNAYEIPHSRTITSTQFFSRTVRQWNSLPEDIATLPNLDSFKKLYFHDRIPLCVRLIPIYFFCVDLFTFKDPSEGGGVSRKKKKKMTRKHSYKGQGIHNTWWFAVKTNNRKISFHSDLFPG